jgi:DNA invertase Pin-like site-specific DNA recombinase
VPLTRSAVIPSASAAGGGRFRVLPPPRHRRTSGHKRRLPARLKDLRWSLPAPEPRRRPPSRPDPCEPLPRYPAATRPTIGYARASTVRQSLDTQTDSLRASGVTRIFSEKISTRAVTRPELDRAVALARELRASGVAVTLVVHEHKRLGRGIELAALAEQMKASNIGLEFLTGELQGSHDPSGVVFTVLAALSGMEREYIRDRTLEGHESARTRGKAIGGAAVTDDAMLAVALHLRGQELSLRDIAAHLVISTGKKKGQHPSPATVMRMLRDVVLVTGIRVAKLPGWMLLAVINIKAGEERHLPPAFTLLSAWSSYSPGQVQSRGVEPGRRVLGSAELGVRAALRPVLRSPVPGNFREGVLLGSLMPHGDQRGHRYFAPCRSPRRTA